MASSADSKYILYSNIICPFAHRAHIAAIEKGIPFTYEKVPLMVEIKKDPSLSKSHHFLSNVRKFMCFVKCLPPTIVITNIIKIGQGEPRRDGSGYRIRRRWGFTYKWIWCVRPFPWRRLRGRRNLSQAVRSYCNIETPLTKCRISSSATDFPLRKQTQ